MNVPNGVRAPPSTTMSRSWYVGSAIGATSWSGCGRRTGQPTSATLHVLLLLAFGADVEALAILFAVAPGLHHAAQQGRRRVGRVRVLSVDSFGGVERRVEADIVQ